MNKLDVFQIMIFLLLSTFMTSSVGLYLVIFSWIFISILAYMKKRFKFDLLLFIAIAVFILVLFPI